MGAHKISGYGKVLSEALVLLDSEIKEKDYGADTGATACIVLVTDDEIICSNAGDSRGVLYTGQTVEPLSYDHKPDNEQEEARIKKVGHFVEDSRVDGNLALSRAIGDFQYKDNVSGDYKQQAVTCDCDVKTVKRSKGDKFIMLACDGIWDCLTNEQCCDKTNTLYDEHAKKDKKKDLHNITEKILDSILAPNTDDGIGTDNMTAILIVF